MLFRAFQDSMSFHDPFQFSMSYTDPVIMGVVNNSLISLATQECDTFLILLPRFDLPFLNPENKQDKLEFFVTKYRNRIQYIKAILAMTID